VKQIGKKIQLIGHRSALNIYLGKFDPTSVFYIKNMDWQTNNGKISGKCQILSWMHSNFQLIHSSTGKKLFLIRAYRLALPVLIIVK
jgi:hypothetical protein